MRKKYLLSMALATGILSANAQNYSGNFPEEYQKKSPIVLGDEAKIKSNTHEILGGVRAPGDVIWTEDFANGLAGNNSSTSTAWSLNPLGSSNIWKHSTVGSRGWFSGGQTGTGNVISSPTASNGFMLFDTDSANSTFDASGLATGWINAANPLSFPSTIQSPVIDMTGRPGAVVSFYTRYRHCCDGNFLFYLEVSTDGFTTSTAYPINEPGDANNEFDGVYSTNISSAITGNPANVQIRFNWGVGSGTPVSEAYFWQVDDIEITEPELNDLRMEEALFSVGPLNGVEYYSFPRSQVTDIAFIGRTINFGSVAQTNVSMKTEISNAATHTQNSPTVASVPANIMDTTILYDTLPTALWSLPAVNGDYDFTFTPESDSVLKNLTDDTIAKTIAVTDFTFARDNSTINGAFQAWNNGTGPGSIGCDYEMFGTDTMYAVNVGLWSNTDLTNNPVLSVQIDKFDFVNQAYNTITTKSFVLDQARLGTVTAYGVGTRADGVPVAAGDIFLLTAGSFDQANAPVRIYMAQKTDQGTVLGYNNGQLTSLIDPEAPIIRANFDPAAAENVGVEDVNDLDVSLEQNYPNPFNNSTVIEYNLAKAGDIKFQVIDLMGKVVMSNDYGTQSQGTHKIEINSSDLSVGVYYYSVIMDGQRVTKRMILTK